jgi:hypothetical protein
MSKITPRILYHSPPRPPQPIVQTLGKVLVIWGVLAPLIALPFTARGPYRVIPLLEVSIRSIEANFGALSLPFQDVIVGALVSIGVGLSLAVLPKRGARPLPHNRKSDRP